MADFREQYQQDYLQRAQALANSPYTPFGQSTTAAANPWQTSSWERTYNRGMQGAPEVSAARDQLVDTIGGGGFTANPFLSGDNPYLQSQIDQASGDVVRNYNLAVKPQTESAMVNSGSFGNAGLQQMQGEQQRQLAQELGRTSGNLRFADYSQRAGLWGRERDRQMAAVAGAPQFAQVDYADLGAAAGAGNALQGQQQAEITSDYNQYLDARNYPYQGFGAYSQAMGLGNMGNVPQAQPQPNRAANAIGGALAGYQLGGGAGGENSGWGALAGGLLGAFG